MSLLEVSGLGKVYKLRTGVRARANLVAADDITISIERGETLALVGESGSGKTTVGRCVLRLEEPTSGEVAIGGEAVTGLPSRALRERRGEMQMVFQDPLDSLNPRHTAGEVVAPPPLFPRLLGK